MTHESDVLPDLLPRCPGYPDGDVEAADAHGNRDLVSVDVLLTTSARSLGVAGMLAACRLATFITVSYRSC